MNTYLKNGLLILLMIILGGSLGFGVSKLMQHDRPRVEIRSGSIPPISQHEAFQKVKFQILAPVYFKNREVKYYLFPDQKLKIDYEDGKSKIPLASLDVYPVNPDEKLSSDQSFAFPYGIAHIFQDKEGSFLWFTRNNVNYVLSIQSSQLPKDKQKALTELKKIANSYAPSDKSLQ